MLAITHFALGMTFGLLLLAPLVSRFDNTTIVVLSGLFALVPDLNKFHESLSGLHEGLWVNLFYFHGLLDWLETSYPNVEAFIALGVLLTAVVLTERGD